MLAAKIEAIIQELAMSVVILNQRLQTHYFTSLNLAYVKLSLFVLKWLQQQKAFEQVT